MAVGISGWPTRFSASSLRSPVLRTTSSCSWYEAQVVCNSKATFLAAADDNGEVKTLPTRLPFNPLTSFSRISNGVASPSELPRAAEASRPYKRVKSTRRLLPRFRSPDQPKTVYRRLPVPEELRGEHVDFLASFSSPAHVFEQLSVIYALSRLFVASFTLVLPFFPTGSFERMEEEGDVPTAVTLAWMLSNIPMSRGGPTSLVIYDIHALQVVIAFPDDGAWKRFHKLFDNFAVVVCTKVREGDKRIVRIKEGNVYGHHVVIVDDLVQSGGTLIECQKVLAAHGAAKVSAYVTHGVFPNQSWMRFTHKDERHQQAKNKPYTQHKQFNNGKGLPPFDTLENDVEGLKGNLEGKVFTVKKVEEIHLLLGRLHHCHCTLSVSKARASIETK
ncbi:hypothetical protein Fmac_032981 [Flemingia macrophylla]|uniref:Phosphoribosyltransferase domain-containing protein n=1 Tax=Flemingia macrophylla TaxID=520843 RepID=A0ABD1L6G3_9FABA